MVEKVIILGSGPAGLSAAIYTAREGFEPLVIGGYIAGGQLELTTLVENIPGFPEGVMGPAYVNMLRKQAQKFGARVIDKDVTRVDFGAKPLKVYIEDEVYETRSVIIATGANSKQLGVESEKRFSGRGVSYCGTCDGPLFKGKRVIVIGGGDTAMEDSLFLAQLASEVTVVHRRDAFRASKVMQDRVKSNPKVKIVWNSTVEEILGDTKVTGVRVKNVTNSETTELSADGVFIAIGHAPNSAAFKDFLKLDDGGYIITKEEVLTDIEGVFVAGDVADRKYRQAATASGSGVKAALEVRSYISELSEKKQS